MDIVGSIDACISLAERLRKLVQSYTRASESSSKMRLFDSQLGIIRLRLLRTAIAENVNILTGDKQAAIRPALKYLQKQLEKAVNNLPEVHTALQRMQWAIWGETTAISGFQDIHHHMDQLQNIVQLARLAPKQKSLTEDPDNFKLYDLTTAEYLKGTRNYSVQAYWRGLAPHETQRTPVRVLVESYRGYNELVVRVAQKLWWSCDDHPGFQTGVLPCIGFTEHRLISLLPRNVKDQQTLRDLICGKGRQGESIEAPLEARFSIALQLAEAVLKVHSAGLVHCAIRSDTVLFLTPEEKVEPPAPHESIGKPTGHAPPKRSDTWKNTTGAVKGLIRRVTGLAGQSTDNFRESSKNAQPKPTRKTSQRSMRNETRSRRITTRHGLTFHNKSSDDSLSDAENVETSQGDLGHDTCNSINPTAGDVPPGFGSVYLIDWSHMCYRGSAINPRGKNWAKDIYRHPELLDNKSKQPNMGHDIYSLGVCLLEIGLWESFIHMKDNHYTRGRLAEEVGLSRDEAYTGYDLKQELVKIVDKTLPRAMGKGYADLVRSCLRCLDHDLEEKDKWDTSFQTLSREDDCKAFRKKVLSFLLDVNSTFAT